MTKYILAILLLFSAHIGFSQVSTQKDFVGTVDFLGFTLGGTADVTGTLGNFNDQTNTYFAFDIQVGDIVWDNFGNRWKVEVINSSNILQAIVDLSDINNFGGIPVGRGQITRETPNFGLSLLTPDNAVGMSQQLKSRIESHNNILIDSVLQDIANSIIDTATQIRADFPLPLNPSAAGQGLTKTGDTIDLGGVVDRNTRIGLSGDTKFEIGQDKYFAFPVGTISYPSSGGWSVEASRINDHLIIWGGQSGTIARVYNVSSLASPVLVGQVDIGDLIQTEGTVPANFRWFGRVDQVGNIAFAASDTTIASIDFSDPTNPIVLDAITSSETAYPLDGSEAVLVSGNYLYVQVNASSGQGVIVVDISNPSNMSVVSDYTVAQNTTMSFSWDLEVYEETLFVGRSYQSVVAIDISDPLNPSLAYEIDAAGQYDLRQIEIQGNYLYVADGNFSDAIVIYDVSTLPATFVKRVPSNIDIGYHFNGIEGFELNDGLLAVYGFDANWNNYGVTLIDVNADPLLNGLPVFSTQEVSSAGSYNQSFHVDTDFFGLATYDNNFQIWDVSPGLSGISVNRTKTSINNDTISVLASVYENFPSPFTSNGLSTFLSSDAGMDTVGIGGDLSMSTDIRLDNLILSIKNRDLIERVRTLDASSDYDTRFGYEAIAFDPDRSQIYATGRNTEVNPIDVIRVNPDGSMIKTYRLTLTPVPNFVNFILSDTLLYANETNKDSLSVFSVHTDSISLLGKIPTEPNRRIFDVEGSTLYRQVGTQVALFDVTNPLIPSPLGQTPSMQYPTVNIESISTFNNVGAFSGVINNEGRIYMFDASDQMNPVITDSLVSGVNLPSLTSVTDVLYEPPYLYFFGRIGSTSMVGVADASNPSNLQFLDTLVVNILFTSPANIELAGDRILAVGGQGSTNRKQVVGVDLEDKSNLKFFDSVEDEFPELDYPNFWNGIFSLSSNGDTIFSSSPSGVELMLVTFDGGIDISKSKTLIDSDTIDISGATTLIGFPSGGGLFDAANNGDTIRVAQAHLSNPNRIRIGDFSSTTWNDMWNVANTPNRGMYLGATSYGFIYNNNAGRLSNYDFSNGYWMSHDEASRSTTYWMTLDNVTFDFDDDIDSHYANFYVNSSFFNYDHSRPGQTQATSFGVSSNDGQPYFQGDNIEFDASDYTMFTVGSLRIRDKNDVSESYYMPIGQPTADQVIGWDGVTLTNGEPQLAFVAGGGGGSDGQGINLAANGLTAIAGGSDTTVVLGGDLNQSTTIDANGNTFELLEIGTQNVSINDFQDSQLVTAAVGPAVSPSNFFGLNRIFSTQNAPLPGDSASYKEFVGISNNKATVAGFTYTDILGGGLKGINHWWVQNGIFTGLVRNADTDSLIRRTTINLLNGFPNIQGTNDDGSSYMYDLPIETPGPNHVMVSGSGADSLKLSYTPLSSVTDGNGIYDGDGLVSGETVADASGTGNAFFVVKNIGGNPANPFSLFNPFGLGLNDQGPRMWSYNPNVSLGYRWMRVDTSAAYILVAPQDTLQNHPGDRIAVIQNGTYGASNEYTGRVSFGPNPDSLATKDWVRSYNPGGDGNGIYGGSGSLSGNTTITGGGYNVDFDNTGTFEIDATQFQIRNSGGLIRFPTAQVPSDILSDTSLLVWTGSGLPGANTPKFINIDTLRGSINSDGNGIISALPAGNVAINANENQFTIDSMSLLYYKVTGATANSELLLGGLVGQPTLLSHANLAGDKAQMKVDVDGATGIDVGDNAGGFLFFKTRDLNDGATLVSGVPLTLENPSTGSVEYDVNNYVKRGNTTDTTNGSGQITIAHGITVHTPDWANATVWGTNDYKVNVVSINGTNLVLEIRDSAGSTVNSTSVTVSWQAGKAN